MTTIEMETEFDYFTVSREVIVDALAADGYAHKVTDRVAGVINRLAETAAGYTTHREISPWIYSDYWNVAIRGYIKGLVREGEFGGVPMEGSLDFDSFADGDGGYYWVIDLHHKNVDRGKAFEYRYLVLISEGRFVQNIGLAFTCDDRETVEEVIRPSSATMHCPNPDCEGYLQCSDGYALRTEQDVRYEPERGEYDADGIYCPFCTSYSTGYPGTIDGVLMPNTRGDAVYLPHRFAAEGDVQEPFHLRAVFYACE